MSHENGAERVDREKGPCGICSGAFSEHLAPNVKHVWVPEDSNELISKQQQAEKNRAPQVIRSSPPVIHSSPPGDSGIINRLVELLLDKNLLNSAEGLYIAGIGEKPKPQQYRDPVV
jgi:hypothetical protein